MAKPTDEQNAIIKETAQLAKKFGVMARPGLDFDARQNGDIWLSTYAEDILKALRLADALPECSRHGGTWGTDPTCLRCTYADGTPYPVTVAYSEGV